MYPTLYKTTLSVIMHRNSKLFTLKKYILVYVFQMPKFYSICSVWTSCEFFVSHCILRGLRRPLYLFFFLCISPSLPFLPLSLQPKTLLPKTSFFPKRQTRLCRNPRIHQRPIIYSVEKNFCWPLESIPGTLSPKASVLSNKPWWIHKSRQQICWFSRFLSIFSFLGLIFKARIFFLPFSFFKYFFFKYLI